MNTDELLHAFLSEHPDSTSTYDRERFIRYAFAGARDNRAFDKYAFEKAGVSNALIHDYETAYSWIRDIVEMTKRGERL